MKPEDHYLKFVRWNDADAAYVGYCPDLFPWGGVCHAPVEEECYRQICTLVREDLAASELLQKKLNGWPQTKLERAGKLFSLQEVVAEKPTLLVLLNTNDEPARRLLQALAPLQSELAQRGINLAGIYVGQEGREEYEKWATELGVTMDVYDDANKELFKEIGALTQPAVILLTPEGSTVLWTEGYATHVPQLVKAALKKLK